MHLQIGLEIAVYNSYSKDFYDTNILFDLNFNDWNEGIKLIAVSYW